MCRGRMLQCYATCQRQKKTHGRPGLPVGFSCLLRKLGSGRGSDLGFAFLGAGTAGAAADRLGSGLAHIRGDRRRQDVERDAVVRSLGGLGSLVLTVAAGTLEARTPALAL